MRLGKKVRYLCEAAVIAAIYAVLTALLAPISFGMMQVRVSEALCVLPFFTPAAVPGLFAGCLISNFAGTLMGTSLGPMDIIVGSLSTLAAALAARRIKQKWLVPLPAVVINAFTVAWVLNAMLGLPYWLNAAFVGLGQAVACYAIGMPLLFVLNKYRKAVFRQL